MIQYLRFFCPAESAWRQKMPGNNACREIYGKTAWTADLSFSIFPVRGNWSGFL